MDTQSNEYISKALKIASDLMGLAGDADTLADDTGWAILSGIMRDCAYKIRRHAGREHQAHKANGQMGPHILKVQCEQSFSPRKAIVILGLALILGVVARPANATTIILSTDATETLGGLTFSDGDLAEYDATADTATLYFDENLFGGNENIDALHVLSSGNLILSTSTPTASSLGGLSFGSGDLAEYNPTTDTATLYFDESLFGSNEDIDAVHVLTSGNIILSTTDAATLGGLSFSGGDLIEYNPTTDTATLFFDESLFGGSENVDAAHVLGSGNIILSTEGGATLGGQTFADGDLVEYNPATDTATLYFNESLFSNNADIDGVYIATAPEPATIVILGLGSLVLIHRRRRLAKTR